MLYFSPWKVVLIVLACVGGFVFAAPSFLPRETAESLPVWLPHRQVSLGLDLQGGSHLLLEVDTQAVIHERLEGLVDSIRRMLREKSIGYRGLGVENGVVTLEVREPEKYQQALDEIHGLATPLAVSPLGGGGGRDIEVTPAANNRIVVRLTEPAIQARTKSAVEQSIEIVRRRIDEVGTREPIVQRQGANRILVQLPGEQDPDRIKRLLGQTAKMTFRLVDTSVNPQEAARGHLPAGTELLESDTKSSDRPTQWVVQKRVMVGGESLVDAQATFERGQPVVSFKFDSVGARRFGDATRNNVGRPFAIVLDDKVISAPVIREPILGGSGIISGNFTVQSASDLAVLLRAGALPAPLNVIEERTVGPDLGADSIRAGLISIAVATVLVFIYMGLAYGLFGLFADVALLVNLAMTLAVMSLLEATLTLPGIAGLLLTLGMSVDANVLINERIREETRLGRSPLAALEAGFRRAYSTIVDSNLTTLLKMVLLYTFGSGAVKGFAVTISFGIMTSMFTATVLVRLMIVAWMRRVRPKVLPVKYLFRLLPDETSFPFMKGRIAGLAVSAVLSLASIGLFFYPGLNYGVDFKGGIVMEARLQQAADFPALRQLIENLDLGEATLQEFGSPQDVLIRMSPHKLDDVSAQHAADTARAALTKAYPGTEIRRVEAVGSSVSAELFRDGMIAMGLALVLMLVYIWFRFEWQFGVGAVATLVLDVTKVIGFYAITGIPFNLVAIAAILTVMGFSINDKVVVYDRVRENLRKYKSMPLRNLIDRSINETLNRTVNTSITVFLSTLPLALFGGESVMDFAIVLLFGVFLATSSSIFIAAPILLFLGDHRLRRDRPAAAERSAAVEAR
jgi:SecD/SecF fusion protein